MQILKRVLTDQPAFETRDDDNNVTVIVLELILENVSKAAWMGRLTAMSRSYDRVLNT